MSYKVTVSFVLTGVESPTNKYEDVVARVIPLIPSVDPAKMHFQVDKELPKVSATDTDKVLITTTEGASYEVDLSGTTPKISAIPVEPE